MEVHAKISGIFLLENNITVDSDTFAKRILLILAHFDLFSNFNTVITLITCKCFLFLPLFIPLLPKLLYSPPVTNLVVSQIPYKSAIRQLRLSFFCLIPKMYLPFHSEQSAFVYNIILTQFVYNNLTTFE